MKRWLSFHIISCCCRK